MFVKDQHVFKKFMMALLFIDKQLDFYINIFQLFVS